MFSPASERNKAPIAEALQALLPARGTLLELACGSLQHACHIAPKHPLLKWLPTDIDADVLAHGEAQHTTNALPPNVEAPRLLDASAPPPWFETDPLDVIYTANLLHVSALETARGVFAGAAHHLAERGQLLIYGPFKRNGQHTSAGNRQFDEDLRRRNTGWGIRDIEALEDMASQSDLCLEQAIPMPANNFLLRFNFRTLQT